MKQADNDGYHQLEKKKKEEKNCFASVRFQPIFQPDDRRRRPVNVVKVSIPVGRRFPRRQRTDGGLKKQQ
jgi:hypothetical protein